MSTIFTGQRFLNFRFEVLASMLNSVGISNWVEIDIYVRNIYNKLVLNWTWLCRTYSYFGNYFRISYFPQALYFPQDI